MAATVITTLPVTPSVVARISTGPGLRPVTRPDEETEATAASAVLHSKARSSSRVPPASWAVAASCTACPESTVVLGAVTMTVAVTGVGGWILAPPPPQAETEAAMISMGERAGSVRRRRSGGFGTAPPGGSDKMDL